MGLEPSVHLVLSYAGRRGEPHLPGVSYVQYPRAPRMDADNHSGVAVDELTEDERIALYDCLKADFQEEINSDNLSKWLRQDACSQ